MSVAASYYENKSLSQVCSGGQCLKSRSVMETRDMAGEDEAVMRSIRLKGSLALARQMPGPRDLDGRVGEIQVRK